ncbi:MAG: 50S ribosome-binding GTPase [Leptolyngbya sp. Prado105]|jgi:uncharacterized protein (DUF697 family)|nr:50S ribosome-binding GTPase [Leptolyngbya sp. Prado105]
MKWDSSWLNQVRDGIAAATKHVSIEPMAKTVQGWFKVDEAEVEEILRKVRSELPTTEALLVGKPQSGKSSIVRGITGISAEIVGQGFRPHTQYTQQYSYPTEELPLLVFTDTVGLGEGLQETSEVIRELVGELQPGESNAKILILTVKISDFATDTLKQIAARIRQKHPDVPVLLAVTCTHELYPTEVSDHPDYPPSLAEVDRAFTRIQSDFKSLFDQAVLIDFTLEEDEFHPALYGLEPLMDTIAQLLPEAEARTISQLLHDRDAGKQISDLYREAARRYILPFSVMAGAAAAIPLPLATMPVLTALQVSMVGALGQLYGQTLSPSQAGGVVSAIAGGFVAQAIGRELIKFVPGFGSVIAASWASAYTWALGEAACVYFGDLMGGKTPDPKRIQTAMREAFQDAKDRFKPSKE